MANRKKSQPKKKTAKSTKAAKGARTTAARQRAFLKAYATCGNICLAAESAGIERRSHYRWSKDAKYREAFDEAQQEAGERLEAEARRRAEQGVRRLKFHCGEPVMVPCNPDDPEAVTVTDGDGKVRHLKQYSEHEYSDTLLIFLLKANFPKKYRENQTAVSVQVDSRNETTVQVLEDGDWYGNTLRMLAAGIAPHRESSSVAGSTQGNRGRAPVGKNGNGAAGNGKGPRK